MFLPAGHFTHLSHQEVVALTTADIFNVIVRVRLLSLLSLIELVSLALFDELVELLDIVYCEISKHVLVLFDIASFLVFIKLADFFLTGRYSTFLLLDLNLSAYLLSSFLFHNTAFVNLLAIHVLDDDILRHWNLFIHEVFITLFVNFLGPFGFIFFLPCTC